MSKDTLAVANLHMEGGINCAQAMFSVYGGKYFGVPRDLAIKAATGLGGGLGGLGKTCGTVSGAAMVLGMMYEIGNPRSRGDIYALVREFTKRFVARHGSIACAELLGYNLGTEDGLRMIKEKGLFRSACPAIDQSAAEILEEMLAEKGITVDKG